jgi:hypothetical protein
MRVSPITVPIFLPESTQLASSRLAPLSDNRYDKTFMSIVK